MAASLFYDNTENGRSISKVCGWLQKNCLVLKVSSIFFFLQDWSYIFTFTFMHLADTFIQSDSGYTFFFVSMCIFTHTVQYF